MIRARSIVSSQLIDTTARTALRLAAGEPLAAVVPAQLAELVTGVSSTMTAFKLTFAASVLALGGLAACGALIFAAQPPGGPPGAPRHGRSPRKCPPLTLALGPTAEASVDFDPMTSYPYTLDSNKVREFAELTVKFQDIQLTTGPVVVVPIDCERGTTGAVIVGAGKFEFTPENGKWIEGAFRSVVLRFNPDDQPAIIPFDKGKMVKDLGAIEMSRHMLGAVLGHCYHRGP